MNPETLFEQFESRLGTRGVGLGLPISRQLVRRMGGDLKLSNIEDSWNGDVLHRADPGDCVQPARISTGGDTVEQRRASTMSGLSVHHAEGSPSVPVPSVSSHACFAAMYIICGPIAKFCLRLL